MQPDGPDVDQAAPGRPPSDPDTNHTDVVRPTLIYRFYDEEDVLLYVGITDRGPRRWREHMAEKPWWDDVARVDLERCPTRERALDREREIIQTESPVHNVVHAHARPGRVRRLQTRHRCPSDRRGPFSDYLHAKDPGLERWCFSWYAPLDMWWSQIHQEFKHRLHLPRHGQETRARYLKLNELADVYWSWVTDSYTDDEWGLGQPQTDACPRCRDYCSHLPTTGPSDCQGSDPFTFNCLRCGHVWNCWFGMSCYDPHAIDFWRWHNRNDLCTPQKVDA